MNPNNHTECIVELGKAQNEYTELYSDCYYQLNMVSCHDYLTGSTLSALKIDFVIFPLIDTDAIFCLIVKK